VAEQLLDHPEVRAALQEMGREAVPERVGTDALRQAGDAPEPVQAAAQATNAEGLAVVVEEDGRRLFAGRRGQSTQELWTSLVQVLAQGLPRGPSEQPDPLLATFAQDAQVAAPEVQAAQVRGGQLADAEARRVGGLHERPIPQGECPCELRVTTGHG